MNSKLMNKVANNLDNGRLKMIRILCYNDDVLTEILLRLPAKSLIKFKLVCKHWLSLISTDQFCHLHTLRHPKPEPSLMLHAYNTSQFFYFDPIPNPHKQLIPCTFPIPDPEIISSCNGLLLLQSDQLENAYYVYNPTTRRSRKISLTNSDKYTNILGLSLAFDPSTSSHYKIVCVRAETTKPLVDGAHDGWCYQIEVYESESAMWKLCVDPFTTSVKADFSCGVHWKNSIHFFNYPYYLYFDTNKYVIGNMPPPPPIPWPADVAAGAGGVAVHYGLQESNGHLYYFIDIIHHGDNSIVGYELQDDYSRWLMKYPDGFGQLPRPFHILRFIRGDDGQACTLVTHVPGKIMVYRFLDKSCKELVDVDLTDQSFYGEHLLQFCSDMVHQFGESMAPV